MTNISINLETLTIGEAERLYEEYGIVFTCEDGRITGYEFEKPENQLETA
ncbi:MAG: hypothetical protein K5669_11320 [Lachnospiraceae bacterium]|nr:hypothetical protein [Lachnospiraceae bacterium]